MLFLMTGIAQAQEQAKGKGHGQGGPPSPPPRQGVPEINPGSAIGALALLGGGMLVLTDRLRRRSSRKDQGD